LTKNCLRLVGEGEADDLGYGEGTYYDFEKFKDMANLFKARWAKPNASVRPPLPAPASHFRLCTSVKLPTANKFFQVVDIEKEYWRLVESGAENCVVQYGSDLDVASHCSGFPLNKSRNCPETPRFEI